MIDDGPESYPDSIDIRVLREAYREFMAAFSDLLQGNDFGPAELLSMRKAMVIMAGELGLLDGERYRQILEKWNPEAN